MRVAVIGPNLRDQSKGQFHVHTAGCRDGKNGRKYPLGERHEEDVTSRRQVVVNMYGDMMASDYALRWGTVEWNERVDECEGEFYFHNCVKDLQYWDDEEAEG